MIDAMVIEINSSDLQDLSVNGEKRDTTGASYYGYDIVSWLESKTTLDNFKLKKVSKAVFKLTDKQFDHVQQLIKIYGDSDSGLCKVCNYTYNTVLWRKPVLSKEITIDVKS